MEQLAGKTNKSERLWMCLRDVLSFILWAFFIIKVFIFDIDVYMVNAISSQLLFIIKYKLFVFLVFVLSMWCCLGNRKFRNLLVYFLFFPFVFLFWKIPKILLRSKSWIVVLGYFSLILSFLKSMKFNLIIFTILSISVVLIFKEDSKYVLIPAMSVLGIYLVWHYTKRFIGVFKKVEVIGINTAGLENFCSVLQKHYTDVKLVGEVSRENMTEKEHKACIEKLQEVLLFDKLWYFVASNLSNFKKSRIYILLYFMKLLWTLCITVLIFALLNYSVYKIEHNAFVTPTEFKGFFPFVYYSFNTIFTSSVVDFYPMSISARLLNSIELSFGALIALILLFLLTTVLKERHTEELDEMIELARVQGQHVDKIIQSEFNLTVEEAMKEVEKIKGSMLKLICYFASGDKY